MNTIPKEELPEWILEAIEAAKSARVNAYAPYSNYKVGAAIVDDAGNIYKGCNVENAAFTGSHAETGAIAQMVSNGVSKIKAVVCVTKDGGSPCGDCRQRIWEFCKNDPQVPIYMQNDQGEVRQTTIGELLPHAFELN